MTSTNAIPTMYKGIRFRSRLEATWAAFFDKLGWPWQYEPIDLRGYIPDFILPIPLYGQHVLVEVKPAFTLEDLRNHTEKIEGSGWNDAAFMVGANLMTDPEWMDIDGNEPYARRIGLLGCPPDVASGEWHWVSADRFSLCVFCEAIRAADVVICPMCKPEASRPWEFYRKAGYPSMPVRGDYLETLWAEAKNLTQWRAPK